MTARRTFFVLLFAFVVLSPEAYAQTTGCGGIPFVPQISIPGTQFVGGVEMTVDCKSLGTYISSLYTFSVYLASIISAVILMVGGFLWLTAGGNVNQVGTAKSYIAGALSGFVLLLLSWVLLNTINPNLVRFRPLNIAPISRVELPGSTGCCVCATLNTGVGPSGSAVNFETIQCSFGASSDLNEAKTSCEAKSGCAFQQESCPQVNACTGTGGYCGPRSSAPARTQQLTGADFIACNASSGYSCNAAFDCTTGAPSARATGTSLPSAAAHRNGCCLPKQPENGPCRNDTDCINGRCYKDTWFDQDVVGVCKQS